MEIRIKTNRKTGAVRIRRSRTEHPGSTGWWTATKAEYDLLGRVSRTTINEQRSTNAKFIDIDNVLFHNSHIMPYASQRYSADTIISNCAALGDGAFYEYSRTLNGQAPGRESQHPTPDPVLLLRMKVYIKHFLWSLVMLVFAVFSTRADSPATPWSQTITSSNGRYVLVLLSPKITEQENYILQSREFWRKGGIPVEDVPVAEKSLQEEIDKEAAIRKKYSESGLYTAGKSPKLLWKTDFYDLRTWVKVSNDGEHIIVGKRAISPIFEEKPSEYNPDIKEVTKVYPNWEEVILTFYSFGRPLRSYKASELTGVDVNLQPNTNNAFVWSDDGFLNEKEKTLSITKTNDQKLAFDITTGNPLNGQLLRRQNSSSNLETNNTQTSKSGNSNSFCGGMALLLILALSSLFAR